MALDGLTIIGESINDSVPSTRALFEAEDIEGIRQLAAFQDQKGANYIDVNVGARPAAFLADMVRQVQEVTSRPLSIEKPDPQMTEVAVSS